MRIPGLPLYPSFAHWPGPFTPPTRNTPVPLRSISFMGSSFVEERQLLNAFMASLGSTRPAGAAEVMSGLAHGISKAITMWAGTTWSPG
jgi:hypothetical protein